MNISQTNEKLSENIGKEVNSTNASMSLNKNTKEPFKNSEIKSQPKNNLIDDSAIDMINSGRFFNENEIKNAACLLLEELMGDVLRNNKLTINAAGLTTGLRKMKDGVSFFGKAAKSVIIKL
jgi:hypothetical protein